MITPKTKRQTLDGGKIKYGKNMTKFMTKNIKTAEDGVKRI